MYSKDRTCFQISSECEVSLLCVWRCIHSCVFVCTCCRVLWSCCGVCARRYRVGTPTFSTQVHQLTRCQNALSADIGKYSKGGYLYLKWLWLNWTELMCILYFELKHLIMLCMLQAQNNEFVRVTWLFLSVKWISRAHSHVCSDRTHCIHALMCIHRFNNASSRMLPALEKRLPQLSHFDVKVGKLAFDSPSQPGMCGLGWKG